MINSQQELVININIHTLVINNGMPSAFVTSLTEHVFRFRVDQREVDSCRRVRNRECVTLLFFSLHRQQEVEREASASQKSPYVIGQI